MIDLVHNETTGVHVVHDEPELDAVVTVVVDRDGYCTFVSMASSRRSVRRVPEDVLEAVRRSARCSVIRMDGVRPVSDRTVLLRHAN